METTRRIGVPLSDTFCTRVREPGRYGDGGRGGHGLFMTVRVFTNGRIGRAWGQRVRINGRATNLGLGSYPAVTLAEARRRAILNRQTIEEGRDPRRARTAAATTFAAVAERVIKLHRKAWKKGSYLPTAWRASFRTYAGPINDKQVADIRRADVLAILTPIWTAKPATAKVVLQRVGTVLKYAVAEGLAPLNVADPALRAALPKSNGGTRHHKALPHGEVAAALARVRASGASPAARLAVEFLALTACRVGEVLGARWSEIDRGEGVWTVPASRMKTAREHRVPLCDRALEILAEARKLSGGSGLVFVMGLGKQLSRQTPGLLLRRAGIAATPHGFRSSFRDWCAETEVDRATAEASLAHIVQGTEGAYFRTDLLDARRAVAEAWAVHVDP